MKYNKCSRMEVWAMGVDRSNNTFIAFNGNTEECTGEVGNCGCYHAEENLLESMTNPLSVTLSHSPCIDCAKILVNAGVKSVMYAETYRLLDGLQYLHAHGVFTVQKLPSRSLLNKIEESRFSDAVWEAPSH